MASGLLRREKIIRASGVLFLISPISNYLYSLYNASTENRVLNYQGIVAFTQSIHISWYLLSLGSLYVGWRMLRKNKSASWGLVLVIIFMFILFDIFQFGLAHVNKSAQILPLLINIAAFALIYSQEFYNSSIAHIPAQFSYKLKRPIHVDFENYGTWAKITQITNLGLQVKSIKAAPPGIESRSIDIGINNHLTLKAHLQSQVDGNYTFSFAELDQTQLNDLKFWLIQLENRSKAA